MFEYNGHFYAYFDHPYNSTRHNERAVEVPIGLDHLRGRELSTLEVGAVLPHYVNWGRLGYLRHVVVDRYEDYPGVTQVDMLTYEPERLFSRVLSISTLEHVGGAEEYRAAVERMKRWLAPDGVLFITAPAAWDGAPYLTPAFVAGLGMDVRRYDKVDSTRHEWLEVSLESGDPLRYDEPTRWANTVYLMEYRV